MRGFSAISVVATLSVVALVATIWWKWYEPQLAQRPVSEKRVVVEVPKSITETIGRTNWQSPASPIEESVPSTVSMSASSTDPDGLGNIQTNVINALLGSYDALRQQQGAYDPIIGEQIAQSIAGRLRANVSYQKFSASDVKTSSDTSYATMLKYRAAMREALEPLFKIDEAEYLSFARYVESRDPKHLVTLRMDAQHYRDAVARAAKVVVPADASAHHLAALNSLAAFAAILEALAQHADDPFASVALLRTYNDREQSILSSFNALATYYRTKPQT